MGVLSNAADIFGIARAVSSTFSCQILPWIGDYRWRQTKRTLNLRRRFARHFIIVDL